MRVVGGLFEEKMFNSSNGTVIVQKWLNGTTLDTFQKGSNTQSLANTGSRRQI